MNGKNEFKVEKQHSVTLNNLRLLEMTCVLIMHSAGLDKSKTEWHNSHFKADEKHSNYSQDGAAATCIAMMHNLLCQGLSTYLLRLQVHGQIFESCLIYSHTWPSLIPIRQYPNSCAFSCLHVHVTIPVFATGKENNHNWVTYTM